MNRAAWIAIGAIVVGCSGAVVTGSPSSSTTPASPASSPSPPAASATPGPTPPLRSMSPSSSASAELALASAYIAAINAGKLEAAAALIAPGAKARTSGNASYETLADASAALAFVKAAPPCVLEVSQMSQTGPQVVVEAVIATKSPAACPIPIGTGIQIPLTIVNGLITVLG